MIQAPIFHVNGDDPEAVVRVGRLAFEYRQAFGKDVVIDLICYRRRGHNETDNPSFTQPMMYDLIDAKRSVRKLYTEALIGRGDITVEEAEQALRDYQEQLERAFAETREAVKQQRHSVLFDRRTGEEYTPLKQFGQGTSKFYVHDSLLSEYAAVGFEYGYSMTRPDALVCWEAQFGDFANGAQTIMDEYISSSEQKWGQRSSVVLLLPHGYEGQGPDHSSARIERYLQLCAQDNMTVALPSTPANYFHLLRWQALSGRRRPLVVFTPKSMLRLKTAASPVAAFTHGSFLPVIGDSPGSDPKAIR